ncbi:MAG: CvpA family protein [Bacteroidetes bacterium]|nr:CvpA family protein [Bacteroidota bacterium]
MDQLNSLDWVLLAMMIIGFINGFRKGLVMELATLIGLVAGVWLAVKGHSVMEDWLRGNTSLEGDFLPYLAFFAVFVLVYIGFYMGGKALSKTLKILMLGIFDKIGGGLFGAFKLFAFSGLFVMLLNHFGLSAGNKNLQSDSVFAQPAQSSASWMAPAVKKILNDERPDFIDQLLDS